MLTVILFASCNITKQVKNNDLLLVKNKIEIHGQLNKDIRKDLPNYYKQRPNDAFLGMIKFKLMFFNLGSGGKKDNGVKRFFRDKLGEAPVLVDSVYIESTMRSLKTILKGEGHYYSEIKFRVIKSGFKNKKGTVIYDIYPGNYYRFYNYELNIADKDIYELVKSSMSNSFIINGNRFDQDNIYKEQERIVNLLQNNGFYVFTKEFVGFDTDTAIGNYNAYIALNIRNKSDTIRHKKYMINDITIEIDKPRKADESIQLKDTIQFRNFHYVPRNYLLDPDIIDHNLFLRRGELYRQLNFTRSYGRLNDLGIFRFINISPKITDGIDTSKIDYTIKLVPSVKYNFSIEPQLISSDQDNIVSHFQSYGVAATAQFGIKNVFRNAELFQLTYRTAFEAQGHLSGGTLFNATEQSLSAALTIPHIWPLSFFDRNVNLLNTKTTIVTSAIYEYNLDYDRKIATLGLNYQFNKKLISYYWAPFEFSFIKTSLNPSSAFQAQAQNDIFLQNLFSSHLIWDGRFGFTVSNKTITKTKNFYYLRFDALELAGNVLTLANMALNNKPGNEGNYTFFGVNYYQYAKSAFDYRFNRIIDKNNAYVFRVFSGIMVPYGNSQYFTPFDKRFFVGGANSLRGWVPRALGPGTFNANNQIDHSGDIKLEANAEFRFNMYNLWLEGAFFADAGNVWILKPDATRPGAEFNSNNFYNQIASDFGFGIRLNFSIVLIRFDFGIPIYDPRQSVTDYNNITTTYGLVIKKISDEWLLNNGTFNFGIGYPF